MKINIITSREELFKEILTEHSDDLSTSFNGKSEDFDINIIDCLYNYDSKKYNFTYCVSKIVYFFDRQYFNDNCNLEEFRPDNFIIGDFSFFPSFYSKIVQKNKKTFNDSYKIKSSKEINTVISSIMNKYEFPYDHFKERVVVVLNELLFNAIFNAPLDDMGNPKFRFLDRKEEVLMPKGKEVDLKIENNKDHLIVECTDYYGSLNENIIKNYVYRTILRPENKKGGAGLGLNLIFNNINEILFDLSEEKHTKITIKMIKTKRNLDYLKSYKYLDISFDGEEL